MAPRLFLLPPLITGERASRGLFLLGLLPSPASVLIFCIFFPGVGFIDTQERLGIGDFGSCL